jgi:flagellar biosynthetic protein FliR
MTLPITSVELASWMASYFLPFLRVSALMLAAPVFGAKTVPVRVRIVLAAYITVLIASVLPVMTPVDFLSPAGVVVAGQQVVVGLAMGFIFQMVFAAMVIAGNFIAMTMGLGFAMSVDPQNGVQVPVLSQFYVILSTLAFLAMDMHLLLIRYLADSFVLLPLDTGSLPASFGMTVSAWASQMFIGALMISLPIITVLLLINIALGVITRAAPQLNIFAVGFPVTIFAGFVLVMLTLPNLMPVIEGIYISAFEQIVKIVTQA